MKNIYLIKSSSYRLTDQIIKDIVKDETDITINSLEDKSIYEIIDDASYFGLFSNSRVIIIKDVKYFGGKFNYEEEANAIKKFLDNIDESITLIFICDNVLKTKDLTKYAISLGANIIDKSEIREEEIKNIINDYIKSNNIQLNEKALELIMKNSLNNLDIILMEIDKLSNISQNIDVDIINNYGSKVDDDETFQFIDSVVQRKFDTCFLLLDKLVEKNTEILGLISLLANRYVTMYFVKSADQNHVDDEEEANLLGFKNKGRLYYIRKDAKFYTLNELQRIIIDLYELDKSIKTGLNPVYGLKELLLNL